MLLFDMAGTVKICCTSFEAAAENLRASLAAEGGSNIKIVDGKITFDGETGRMSGNRLNNIAAGKIELRSEAGSIELAYVVNIDRWNLIVTTGASTYVIRRRFRRLLKQAFQVP
ncbi:MAG: hypothetical protein H0V72_21545 [Bradyrhizobium sp.]|nr:hypothetical protein [Bradyrhizobium sp.]